MVLFHRLRKSSGFLLNHVAESWSNECSVAVTGKKLGTIPNMLAILNGRQGSSLCDPWAAELKNVARYVTAEERVALWVCYWSTSCMGACASAFMLALYQQNHTRKVCLLGKWNNCTGKSGGFCQQDSNLGHVYITNFCWYNYCAQGSEFSHNSD